MTTKKNSNDQAAMLAKRKLILKQAFEKAKTAKISDYPEKAVKKSDTSGAGAGEWQARESYYKEARRMGYYSDTERGSGSDYRRALKDYGF